MPKGTVETLFRPRIYEKKQRFEGSEQSQSGYNRSFGDGNHVRWTWLLKSQMTDQEAPRAAQNALHFSASTLNFLLIGGPRGT